MTKCGKYRDPDYIKKWRAKNRNKINEYRRNWYRHHKLNGTLIPSQNTYQDENYQKKYYQRNKERIKARYQAEKAGKTLPRKQYEPFLSDDVILKVNKGDYLICFD